MPTINNDNEPDDSPVPILPRWTPEERALWLDMFDSYSTALLPDDEESIIKPDNREEKVLEAVRLGARAADAAIQEFQFRLYAQSEAGDNRQAAAVEVSFDNFTEWLERRTRRRERPARRTKR
jgi:hypothetical protein